MTQVGAWLNDTLRFLFAGGIRCLGWTLEALHWIRLVNYRAGQQRLRQRFALTPGLAASPYTPSQQERLLERARRSGEAVVWATTAGSSGQPKRVPFTPSRLWAARWTYMASFARATARLRLKRTSLYVFAPSARDGTLSTLMLEEQGTPSYWETLQAPYRVHSLPAVRSFQEQYGLDAVRLWILASSNPGVLYSTNPSTLSTFFETLDREWGTCSRLVRDLQSNSGRFSPETNRLITRLESPGSHQRLRRIAESPRPLPLQTWAPGVRAYMCWTGGYVEPFLRRLERLLPPPRFRLIPMYSMSTETVETLPHFHGKEVSFLPVAPGVAYEFLEEDDELPSDRLLFPWDLQVGQNYVMVVSDQYGLRRYLTADVFRVKQIHRGIPALDFLRRQELSYSFTGEKVTGTQLEDAFHQMRDQVSNLRPSDVLACLPSFPSDDPVPHYKLLLLPADPAQTPPARLLELALDQTLGGLNPEYREKRESGRLGPPQLQVLPVTSFVLALQRTGFATSQETQFKFLPLYRSRWEEIAPFLDSEHIR